MTDHQLRSRKRSRTVLTYWHDGLGVAFVVAYVTAEGFLRPIHRFAGYVALAAILLRLLIGGVAPVGSPFRLPRPSLAGASLWWSTRQGRHPLYAWIAAFLLFGIGLTAVTGLIADAVGWFKGPHEVVAEVAVWIVLAHVSFIVFKHGRTRYLPRIGGWLAKIHGILS